MGGDQTREPPGDDAGPGTGTGSSGLWVPLRAPSAPSSQSDRSRGPVPPVPAGKPDVCLRRPGGHLADVVNVSSFLHLQNSSTGASVAAECRLHLPASAELKVALRGRLKLPALLAVSFRSLEVLTTASVQMEASSPMFLQEDVTVRQVDQRTALIWLLSFYRHR